MAETPDQGGQGTIEASGKQVLFARCRTWMTAGMMVDLPVLLPATDPSRSIATLILRRAPLPG